MAPFTNIFCRIISRFDFVYKIRRIASFSHPVNDKDDGKKHWRKTWEEQGEWHSSLKLFAPKEGGKSIIASLIQVNIDLRPFAIRRWLLKKNREKEIFDQRFLKRRHEVLGTDLASAHFILHRGGRIRFYNNDKWYNENNGEIPNVYTPGFFVEAIDASNVNIYYEGLHNLFHLKYLKWLNLNNSSHIDDWCLDYISGEFSNTLEYLDISKCQNITDKGLASLYRMKCLKYLNVSEIPTSTSFELSCLLLEDLHKNLKIEGVVYKQNINT